MKFAPLRTLYAKIFAWFCLTIFFTVAVFFFVASATGSQPFGRRWMALTQDLYARSAVDFYRTGGAPALTQYLDRLNEKSRIRGQLLDATGQDVLGQATMPEVAAVLRQAAETHRSGFRLGRVWTAASPVNSYTFVMEVHPLRGFFDGTFAVSILPRLMAGLLLVAVFCLLLARHITRPIRILEDAATELAAGSLGVRAGPRIASLPGMAPRRDELARMAVAFDRMAERIQQLILAQQEMLGHISHELRSPLTRIGVSLELLRRGESQTPDGLQVDQMQVDLDRLNQMIGEILEITRMDIGGSAPASSTMPVALATLLRSIAQDAAFEAQDTHKRVVFRQDAECVVAGREGQLRSCFENIVRNALLYTPDATLIEIVLARTTTGAEITIRDEGEGVPEEALPRLFELFYRAPKAQVENPDGTGFGLAIAQRIVTLHGGNISAQNRVPHGLEVRITLPAL